MSLTLVLGGVRSGKSAVAEGMAASTGRPVVYVATAIPADEEMQERVARHRARRPAHWRTVETLDLAAAVGAAGEAAVLVDGIGPWIDALCRTEGLWAGTLDAARARVLDAVRRLADAATHRAAPTIVVAEESGLGLVPPGPSARRYLDLCGEALQVLAAAADRVELVVAGERLVIRGPAPEPVPPELRLHGDALATPGALDFAVNVVAEPPPGWLSEAVRGSLSRLNAYPDERPAVRALADRHGRATEEVLPVAGSAEAFWLLAACLRPRLACVVHPTFTEGEAALRTFGRPVVRAWRRGDDFSLDRGAVPEDADLVLLTNPNNPTGTLDPAEAVSSLARPGRLLVVDEAFMEFAVGEAESLASRADLPGVLVLRSLTKLWSLPGLRAGYVLGPADVLATLRAARQPWAVSAPALAALEACAMAAEEGRRRAERVAAARAALARGLASLPGVRVYPSEANFLLVEVPHGPAVRAGLLARGIAVRPAGTFPGLTEHHLRVAVRRPEENEALVRALEEVLRCG